MRPTLLLTLILAAFALMLHAQEPKVVRGIVTTVVNTTVTIASNKDGEMAYATTGETKILKLDGAAGVLADILPGMTVKVATGTSANTASEIAIVPAK